MGHGHDLSAVGVVAAREEEVLVTAVVIAPRDETAGLCVDGYGKPVGC
jgi:hypothetical protein